MGDVQASEEEMAWWVQGWGWKLGYGELDKAKVDGSITEAATRIGLEGALSLVEEIRVNG